MRVKKSTKAVFKLAAGLEEERSLCRTDKMYLSKILGYDFQPTVHADLFANYLQIDPTKALDAQSEDKDRLVLWSRGTYKTTSIVVEIIQLILNFPNIRILLMQGTIKLTRGLLRQIKSHFNGEAFNSRLHEFFPEFCSDGRLGTADTFIVPARQRKELKEGTVTVASPRSVKAGQHYEAFFGDDLVNDQNYQNRDQIQKTIDEFNHYTPLIDPGGYRYVTGTRYAFGDLYEWIIRGGKFKTSIRGCWTVNEDGTRTLLFPQTTLSDGRTIGFTEEMLLGFQAEDPEMFAAQYLNMPISVGAQLFTDELLLSHVRTTAEPTFPKLGQPVLFIDLAASQQKNRDDSVILTGATDVLGGIYVTDGIGGQWASHELAEMVILQAIKHKPVKILIEKTAAGVYFVEYLRMVAADRRLNLPLDFIKVNSTKGAKFERISTVSGFLKRNKLWFLVGLPCWTKLSDQFKGFPKMGHDDYPDTVGLMVQHFAVNMPMTPIVIRNFADYLFKHQETPTFAVPPEDRNGNGSMGSDFGF